MRSTLALVMLLLSGLDALTQDATGARAALAPTGKLRVILFPLPIIATRDADGKFQGVAVDLSRELAKRLNVSAEMSAADTPPATVDAIKDGRADLTYLVNLPARAALIDFGSPYVDFQTTYIAPANSPIRTMEDVDQPGRRIIVPERSSIDAELGKTIKHAKLIAVPIGSMKQVIEMLKNGEGDAYSDLTHLLVAMQADLPESRIVPGTYMTTSLSIAFGKGKPAGAAFANEFIADMKKNGIIEQAIIRAGLKGAIVAK